MKYGHQVSGACKGKTCGFMEMNLTTGNEERCGKTATHRVRELNRGFGESALTAYICCQHFRGLMGPAVKCKRWPIAGS